MKFKFCSLLMTLCVFFSVGAKGFYIEKLLGEATPEYKRDYFSRMWSWYSKEFYNFDKNLNSDEKRFISLWKSHLTSWGVQIDENFYWENFKFLHQVHNESVNHSLFYCGGDIWSKEQINLLKKILKGKNIKVNKKIKFEDLLGVSWNVKKNIFNLYFVNRSRKEIVYHSYQQGVKKEFGEIKKTKITKTPIRSLSTVDMISSYKITSNLKPEVNLYRYKSFFVHHLSKKALNISIKHYDEFNQALDFLEIINDKEYTLYYP